MLISANSSWSSLLSPHRGIVLTVSFTLATVSFNKEITRLDRDVL